MSFLEASDSSFRRSISLCMLGFLSCMCSSLCFLSACLHIRAFCNVCFNVSMLLNMNTLWPFFSVGKLLHHVNLNALVCYSFCVFFINLFIYLRWFQALCVFMLGSYYYISSFIFEGTF